MVNSDITFFEQRLKVTLNHKTLIRGWIHHVARREKFTIMQLSYVFCDDKFLLSLNKKYLQHNTLTDIITFDYSKGRQIEGELFISIERVKENAKNFSATQKDELHRVMIHGLLHLCGYKDKTASQKSLMKAKENYYLSLRKF